MNVFIVLAHPEPRSFNGALFHTAVDTLRGAGHEVATSDLYGMGFDPVSSRRNFTTVRDPDYLKLQAEELHASEHAGFSPELESELAKMEAADLMIWQFPLWWFSMPGILKGWVDRVFAMGRTYGGGHIYETGKFRGRRALLSLTTGGPQPAYEPGGFNGDLAAILRPVQRGMLAFQGYSVLAPQVHFGAARVDAAQREGWLAAWSGRLRAIEREQPTEVGMY
jgi:NAD(P)H dehydrogenase (quinone)